MSDRFDMPADVWVVEESGFDRERANFSRDPVHGRERPARHPGEPGGGPPGAAVGHVPGRRLRRPRRPGDRPGQLPGLGGHRGLRRRSPPRRGHLHGRHPPPLLGPAGRASDPVHRLRGRRGPADTAGDDALRQHGRPQGLRAACRGHPREPCGGDPGRDRHRRGPPQPRTASALSGRHGVPSGDPVGEMGPRPPSGGVVPVRRGRRPLPRDAHDRHRYPPRIHRRDDLRAAPWAAHGACSAVGGSPRRPCTSVPRARRCGWTSSSPSAPHATRTVPPPEPCATGAGPCSPNTARAGSTPSSPRAARCGGACGTSATARSSAMSPTPAPCGSASTT